MSPIKKTQTPILPIQSKDMKPVSPGKQISESEKLQLDEWDIEDPGNPRNWSRGFKYWITLQLGMLAFAASIGSSITAPATSAIAIYANVSHEVAILSVSLYILGFALGPLCWAPVSEIWGRRWGILPAMFCLGLGSIGTATSKNATSIFLTRFLGGVFGSAPVSNVSAALADIWAPEARGPAVILYSIAVTGGPTLGPIIGAALVVNPSLGWRWTEYVEAIWAFVTFAVCFFALPESYTPVLLKRKAQGLRKQGATNCYHPHEQMKLDFRTIIIKHFTRPLLMLATEPMVTCIAFYASFVYGILYLTLEVFPICFEEIRGMHPVKASLPFLGLFVGVLAAVFINLANQPRYRRISAAAGGKPVPEARFAPVAFAGFIFVAGLFWFAWTAGNVKVSVWHPIVASGLIGAGFNVIFNQCVNVLVDTYGMYAASAVSANTFLRSFMAAGFPLAARPMLYRMGVGPAISILGGIASVMIVVPFLFIKYGSELRKQSKFAPK